MSWISRNFLEKDLSWLILTALCLALLDCALIYFAKRRKPSLKNWYFQFHMKYGPNKVNLLKIMLIMTYFWQPSGVLHFAGGFVACVVLYAGIILQFVFDLISGNTKDTQLFTNSPDN